MSAAVVIFAPHADRDAADENPDPLANTRWMADQTLAKLAEYSSPQFRTHLWRPARRWLRCSSVVGPTQLPRRALPSARWLSRSGHELLGSCTERGHATVAVVDADATRAGLERAAAQPADGVALFAHGREGRPVVQRHARRSGEPAAERADDAIMGADGPALDADNVSILRDRWAHAIACYAGAELAQRACDAGASCFVGYESALIVDWDPAKIPDGAAPLMIALITHTTCYLAEGGRDERALRRGLETIAEAVEQWCQDNPDRAAGHYLEVTAQQLSGGRLVFCARP